MKNFFALMVMALFSSSGMAFERPVVFVEKFVPNGECKITDAKLQILHDRIVGAVSGARKFEVVDRDNWQNVQKELKLVDAGMTEGKAPESNRIKAAGYCIHGKVVQFRNFKRDVPIGEDGLVVQSVYGTVELQIRIENVTTTRMMAKTVKVEKSKQLSNGVSSTQDIELEVMSDATAEAARLVVDKLIELSFPVYVVSANSRCVTGNITKDQVEEGELWEVFVLGDELKDPQTGDSLGNDEEKIAVVRVSRPGPKTTKFAYGETDDDGDSAKKEILSAKEDGEKMLLRRMPKSAAKNKRKSSARDSLRAVR